MTERSFPLPSQLAAGCNLMLLHCLEECRLGFGRGAVDLISEDEMGENRAALKLELASATCDFHDDIRAENIRWHQVRRELNAAERQLQHLAESPH